MGFVIGLEAKYKAGRASILSQLDVCGSLGFWVKRFPAFYWVLPISYQNQLKYEALSG